MKKIFKKLVTLGLAVAMTAAPFAGVNGVGMTEVKAETIQCGDISDEDEDEVVEIFDGTNWTDSVKTKKFKNTSQKKLNKTPEKSKIPVIVLKAKENEVIDIAIEYSGTNPAILPVSESYAFYCGLMYGISNSKEWFRGKETAEKFDLTQTYYGDYKAAEIFTLDLKKGQIVVIYGGSDSSFKLHYNKADLNLVKNEITTYKKLGTTGKIWELYKSYKISAIKYYNEELEEAGLYDSVQEVKYTKKDWVKDFRSCMFDE